MNLTRRQILTQALIAGAAIALPGIVSAADAPVTPSMRISLQLYSVREACRQDFDRTLEEVAAAGFAGVEFAGYHNYAGKPTDLRRRLADLGLVAAGTHIGTATLSGDALRKAIDFHRELDCRYLIIPHDKGAVHPDQSKALADLLNQASEQLAPAGLACGYHNHEAEMKLADGENTWWDLLAQRTVPAVVLQQDCGWTAMAGGDPAAFIRRYPGRSRILHFKPTVVRSEASRADRSPILGLDSVDWKAIVAACREVGGTEWTTIEQERYPTGVTPMDAVRASLDGLRRILAA